MQGFSVGEENCEHEPDPKSFASLVGYDDDEFYVLIDVACKHCGKSGAAKILTEDIQWV